jgi:hypothetical protein
LDLRDRKYGGDVKGIKNSVQNTFKGRPLGRSRHGRIILKWTLGNDVNVWNGFNSLRTGPVMGSCEHGNELLGSIKGGESLD